MIKKILKAVPVIMLICIILWCSAYIGIYIYETRKDSKLNDELRSEVIISEISSSNVFTPEESVESVTEVSGSVRKKPSTKIDITKLMDIYPNACGYIYQKDFISYPVMQTNNNEYYLHRDASGNYSASGSLFFDMTSTNKSRRLVIYGHDMASGDMFGNLSDFKSEEFGKKHSRFYLALKDKTYEADLVCASYTTAGSFMYDTNLLSNEELSDWVLNIRNGALYSFDNAVTESDATLLLSTCTTGDGRFVILLRINGLNDYIKTLKNERTGYLYE